jgi:hypothetical protein
MSNRKNKSTANVDDSQRAANTKFKISNSYSHFLMILIALDELVALVEKYR